MCRHLAYLGPPVRLARLLFETPHSLAHQSWAPRDIRGGGTINADGFGVGWFGPAGPIRYRRATPIWSDTTLPELAAATSAAAVLAAVRSATVGMPVTESAVAPFTDGRWLFSHNGVLTGWPDSVATLAAELPVTDLLTLPAPTDSALLWALVRDRLRAGAEPAEAVAGTLAAVTRVAPGSRLNVLLTDGRTIVASAAGHALSTWCDGEAVLVSSEPLDDDPGWQPVPDGTLVVAQAPTSPPHRPARPVSRAEPPASPVADPGARSSASPVAHLEPATSPPASDVADPGAAAPSPVNQPARPACHGPADPRPAVALVHLPLGER